MRFCRKFEIETNTVITFYDLRSQGVELFRWRLGRVPRACELAFANRMHDFNPSKRTARTPEGLKAEHRVREAFHRPVVLFHEVIEIFGMADEDGRLVGPVVALDSGGVAATLVDGDLFGQSLVMTRLAQEGLGRGSIPVGRQQKIRGLAGFVAA